MTQVEFVDGPLAGTCHEIEGGWPMPCRIAIPDGAIRHWYEIPNHQNDGKAYFVRTENWDYAGQPVKMRAKS